MLLVFAAGGVSVETDLTLAAVLTAGLTVLSIKHRRAAGWRWPGAGVREVVAALTTTAIFGLFLFAATPLAPPNDPIVLPWYLAGLGIGLLIILTNLRVIRMSKIDFEADCRGATGLPATITTTNEEPAWKRRVRAVFSALFVLVWLDGMAYFSVRGMSMRDGWTIPTESHSERLEDHGRVVYITPAEDHLLSTLGSSWKEGILLMIVSALVLQYFLGVFPTRDPE
jgi:hypothetical protein